jgi:hypothetical protein
MPEVIIRRPDKIRPWGINPESQKSGSVWVHMKAFRILNQFSKAVEGIQKVGTPDVQYAFLAPLKMQEALSHEWTAYESVASRLAQKIKDAGKTAAEIQALMNFSGGKGEEGIASKASSILSKSSKNPAQAIENFAREAYNSIPSSVIPNIKIDAPLYYADSNRREITLDFVIFEEGNPQKDIIDPVQDIMKKSSPAMLSNLTIDFPYMWEVYTKPQSWFNYKTCVLIAVNPSWNAPYVYGFPSSCDLSLTFRDLGPLYRSSIEKGTSINVINSNDSNAKRARGDETILSSNPNIRKSGGNE